MTLLKTFSNSPPKSICIVRLSAIGDTCHALAVARAIQDQWPKTRLTWIIGKTEASLLGDIADIEFIIFDKSKGLGALRQVRTQLAGRQFDVCLCLHASMRANGIYTLLQSSPRLGYDRQRARDFQWLFTNHRIAASEHQHVLDGMMEFARHIGVSERPLRWEIPVADADRAFINQQLGTPGPILVISPCSSQRSRNFRNWSVENYAAVANYARERYRCQIVLTGGNSTLEQEYASRIKALCNNQALDLVGKTTLKQLLALIERASAVLCPDTGPAHMATSVATPVIGLYATSNPYRTGPYLSLQRVVNAYPDALQKFLHKTVSDVRWGQRVRDADAMNLIQLADVKNRLDQVMTEDKPDQNRA